MAHYWCNNELIGGKNASWHGTVIALLVGVIHQVANIKQDNFGDHPKDVVVVMDQVNWYTIIYFKAILIVLWCLVKPFGIQ